MRGGMEKLHSFLVLMEFILILTQTIHPLISQPPESLSSILLNCNQIFHLNLQL